MENELSFATSNNLILGTSKMKFVFFKIFILLCLLSISAKSLHAETDTSQILSKAEQLFDRGDYEKSSTTLLKLGSEKIIEKNKEHWSATDIERYCLLKARLSYAFGNSSDMKMWLQKLYNQNPNTKLDPFKDPPQSHEIWTSFSEEDAQKANASENTSTATTEVKTEDKKDMKDEKNLGDQFRSLDDKLRQKSRFWIGLAPLGIGHFDAGYKYSRSHYFIYLVN